jgi:hypothetical protein
LTFKKLVPPSTIEISIVSTNKLIISYMFVPTMRRVGNLEKIPFSILTSVG